MLWNAYWLIYRIILSTDAFPQLYIAIPSMVLKNL